MNAFAKTTLLVLSLFVVLTIGSAQAQPEGLVGYWKFNGDFQDSSGLGNHGINHGASFGLGRLGLGLSLNGLDEYVEVVDNDSLDLNDFTIEAWVLVEDAGRPRAVLDKQGIGEDAATNENYGLAIHESDRAVAGFETDQPGGQDQPVFSSSLVPTGSFVHLAAVYDSASLELRIYINGVLEGLRVVDAFPPNLNDHPVLIGTNIAFTQFLKGVLDEVRLWRIARSGEDIQAFMDRELDQGPLFTCIGFEAPMDSGPVTVKKNRVLPLKAQLVDSEGFPVTDFDIAANPVLQVTFNPEGTSDVIDVTDEALQAGQGTEGNQFVFSDERWRYNLKTKNYTASGTYTITMTSGDEAEYVVDTCTAQFVIGP